MPEDDDPFTTDDYSEAVAYLNERAKEYEDDADANYRVEYGWASGNNFAAVMVWDDDKTHDLGRYIGIELCEDDDQNCRDCGKPFPYNPDADRCDTCIAEQIPS